MAILNSSPVVLWTDILVAAIHQDQLNLVWQEVSDASDPSSPPLYAECLTRLIDVHGAVRFPREFMPHLEVEGSASLVDQAVLSLTMSWLEANPGQALGCNVSARNFDTEGLWAQIVERIRAPPRLADRLVIEITETCPFRDVAMARHCLNQVRRLGVRVALDNFGATEISSALLAGLDVDIVKVDPRYIERPQDLRRLVALARRAAPVVVVEGVEISEHLDAAREAGATHVQGCPFFPGAAPTISRDATSGRRREPRW